MAHRRIATRQRHVAQVRAPFESAVVRHQELPAPDLAVGPVAGAIQRHADYFPAQSILGHATGDVRVMVLHADLLQVRHAQRVLRAQVPRMQIVRHGPRLHAEELLQVGQRLFKEDQRFVILHVADVLAEHRVAPLA